jgi:cytochrome c oxidase subunit I+III
VSAPSAPIIQTGMATLDDERRALNRVWADAPGFWGWLTTVDHKRIGARYVVTAFTFFVLGGLDALLMRAQLLSPENDLVGPDLYNQLFTTHGTNMMFLFAVPMVLALGLYMVPLMVGARNVAYPRLNALGYWVYLFGGILLWVALFADTGPDAGWFAYPPLSGPEFSPGKRVDVWAQMITFTEISALISAVEIIVTAFKCRAPGMTVGRIPVFVWAMIVTAFMVIFAMSMIATASQMLAMDRLIGTHFFNVAEGGDPMLWQHFFWWFGHPEVYIIFIPGTGLIATMLPAFTRRPVFGYTAIVLATIATGFFGYGVWVHHMFVTGVLQLASSFFTSTSVMITIPTAIQIFCWIATIWLGRPHFTTAFLFILGFFITFIIGGLTGVMIASVPFDMQVHDSYFIVAHLHYVILGGMVFPLFAGFYYWFPKWTGRMMSERLGKVHFWLWAIGVNLTFFPMHLLGLEGMPRRMYTYPDNMGWQWPNVTATIGAAVIAVSVIVFIWNAVASKRAGLLAGDDPWGAHTLEWGTSSPPPPYNFARIPFVEGRDALWARTPNAPELVGLALDRREVLITSALDAVPDHRHEDPPPTIWPLLASLAITVMFITLMFTPWGLIWGAALLMITLVGWGWPRKNAHGAPDARESVA